jgi:hypothetical protein
LTLNRAVFYFKTTVGNAVSTKGLSAVLSAFGALWLCISIADYFAKETSVPSEIRGHWWAFFIAGVVIALWICRPLLRVAEKLKDRDVTIELAIGDIFSFKGAIIVGTNSTFDTGLSNQLISERSIQGQFTKKYYGDAIQLDSELNAELNRRSHEDLAGTRAGKNKRYPLGSVVRLNPKGRTGYFLAIAHMNEHGNSLGTFEGLKQSLGDLWVFIGHRGSKEPIVMPVLGSGFTRLPQPRHIIVQEIIKSFIAACSERTFCENLTIVLGEKDLLEHQIDFMALRAYLHHVCTYTEFAMNNGDRVGTPVS